MYRLITCQSVAWKKWFNSKIGACFVFLLKSEFFYLLCVWISFRSYSDRTYIVGPNIWRGNIRTYCSFAFGFQDIPYILVCVRFSRYSIYSRLRSVFKIFHIFLFAFGFQDIPYILVCVRFSRYSIYSRLRSVFKIFHIFLFAFGFQDIPYVKHFCRSYLSPPPPPK